MTTAFVLAAGFGTRLRPLTEHLPKPLVPVGGVPLLGWTLALCRRHGLREVIVNAHHLADLLVPWAGEHDGVRVRVVVEPAILGTGGGLRNARDLLPPRFVVLNGDVLHDVDLGALLAAVPPGGAAMALRTDPDAERYGIVAADETGTVVGLVQVASGPARGTVDRGTHFTGIHAMSRESLDLIPEGFACVVRTAYARLVPERRVAAIRYGGPWLDTGDPATYLDANLRVLDGRAGLALDPRPLAGFARDSDGRRHGAGPEPEGVGPVWIGAGATVDPGATVTRSVVGARARISDGAHLRDCVVWDGIAVPPGHHTRAVFHPGGVLFA